VAASFVVLIVVGTCNRAWPADKVDSETVSSETIGPNASVEGDPNSVGPADAVEAWKDSPDRSTGRTIWSIDYRFRSLVNSKTVKEFGTPWSPPNGWSPLTDLNFPFYSTANR